MKPLLICYPKCSTCAKAEAWLKKHEIGYDYRNISTQNPTVQELKEWIPKSGLPIGRFFNTSGLKYREMNLKEQVKTTPQAELIQLLSTDGMLVKRPILLMPGKVLVGFREEEWTENF